MRAAFPAFSSAKRCRERSNGSFECTVKVQKVTACEQHTQLSNERRAEVGSEDNVETSAYSEKSSASDESSTAYPTSPRFDKSVNTYGSTWLRAAKRASIIEDFDASFPYLFPPPSTKRTCQTSSDISRNSDPETDAQILFTTRSDAKEDIIGFAKEMIFLGIQSIQHVYASSRRSKRAQEQLLSENKRRRLSHGTTIETFDMMSNLNRFAQTNVVRPSLRPIIDVNKAFGVERKKSVTFHSSTNFTPAAKSTRKLSKQKKILRLSTYPSPPSFFEPPPSRRKNSRPLDTS